MAFDSTQEEAKPPSGPDISTRKFIYTAPETISSPTPKRMLDSPSTERYSPRLNRQTPISTRKPPATMPQKLLRVLQALKDENMTLPDFLEELFKSDDQQVAQRTGQFHEQLGAGRVLRIWDDKLNNKKWQREDEDFVNSAVDVVVNRTLDHLNNNDIKQHWRLNFLVITEDN
ncbi:hypothetical protein BGZ89_008591 [Linnemannia elongata]|nr:hypothetical protein BGZ89_008591 [Linnemannia elongata]